MEIKDLVKYLLEFKEGKNISLVIADPDPDIRNVYPVKSIHPLARDEDVKEPCFIVIVGKPEPLDDFVSDGSGQMGFSQV